MRRRTTPPQTSRPAVRRGDRAASRRRFAVGPPCLRMALQPTRCRPAADLNQGRRRRGAYGLGCVVSRRSAMTGFLIVLAIGIGIFGLTLDAGAAIDKNDRSDPPTGGL